MSDDNRLMGGDDLMDDDDSPMPGPAHAEAWAEARELVYELRFNSNMRACLEAAERIATLRQELESNFPLASLSAEILRARKEIAQYEAKALLSAIEIEPFPAQKAKLAGRIAALRKAYDTDQMAECEAQALRLSGH